MIKGYGVFFDIVNSKFNNKTQLFTAKFLKRKKHYLRDLITDVQITPSNNLHSLSMFLLGK